MLNCVTDLKAKDPKGLDAGMGIGLWGLKPLP